MNHADPTVRRACPIKSRARRPLSALRGLAWCLAISSLAGTIVYMATAWGEWNYPLAFLLVFLSGALGMGALSVYYVPELVAKWLTLLLACSTAAFLISTRSLVALPFMGSLTAIAWFVRRQVAGALHTLQANGHSLEGLYNVTVRGRQLNLRTATLGMPFGMFLTLLMGLAYEHITIPKGSGPAFQPALLEWIDAFRNADVERAKEMTTPHGRLDWPRVVEKLRENDWDQKGLLLRDPLTAHSEPDRKVLYHLVPDGTMVTEWVPRGDTWKVDCVTLANNDDY